METIHDVHFGSSENLGFIEDESIELVVTSPPYPMVAMWDAMFTAREPSIGPLIAEGKGGEASDAMHRILEPVWKECGRIVRPGGIVCVNIGDAVRTLKDDFQLYANHARIIRNFASLGFQSMPVLIWRKQTNAPTKFMGSGMLPAGAYVTLEHEYILIFRKGGKRVFDGTARLARRKSAYFWEERNEWFSDIWELKGVRQNLNGGSGGAPERFRSGAFPFELPFRLINMFSLRGETVLDPFCGTGTTTRTALSAGRNSIGVEIDRDLVSIISNSIESHMSVVNERTLERYERHLSFLRARESGGYSKPRYTNEPHSFPVMTQQERKLELTVVTGIEWLRRDEEGIRFRATHELMKGEG